MRRSANEEQVQRSIIDGLQLMGYIVLQTSRRGVSCRHCGAKTFGSDGVTRGLPDLVVSRESWPKHCALLIEVKGPATALSVEQALLERKGRIAIARSWEDALLAVRAFESNLARRIDG